MIDEKLKVSLRYACGELILNALDNPNVVEIMLNPDGRLWMEEYGKDQEYIGEIREDDAKLILSLVASALDLTVNSTNPVVEGNFPLDGSRFEGTYPPIVAKPSFSIRKKASKIIKLEEYLINGVITQEVVEIIKQAVFERKNIIVAGGTSSGKTTFVNAVIDILSELCPKDRLLILEDTPELQSASENTVFFRTNDLAGVTMQTLTKVCMRYAPKRIIVGEVRDKAALELLKAWNTGHPGGIGTLHANSAEETLMRLEELVEEAGNGEKRKLIGRAVDLIVFMEKTKENVRRLSKIIEVKQFNPTTQDYEINTLYGAK
jgi:P-type conjugative transfer ATPase TrbB